MNRVVELLLDETTVGEAAYVYRWMEWPGNVVHVVFETANAIPAQPESTTTESTKGGLR